MGTHNSIQTFREDSLGISASLPLSFLPHPGDFYNQPFSSFDNRIYEINQHLLIDELHSYRTLSSIINIYYIYRKH